MDPSPARCPRARRGHSPAILLVGLSLLAACVPAGNALGAGLRPARRISMVAGASFVRLQRSGRFELAVAAKGCEGRQLVLRINDRVWRRIAIGSSDVHLRTPAISSPASVLEASSPGCSRAVRITSLRAIRERGKTKKHRRRSPKRGSGKSPVLKDGEPSGDSAAGAGGSAPAASRQEGANGRTITVGTAVNEPSLAGSDPRYRETLLANFQGVTPENEMKWETTEPAEGVFNFAPAEYIVDFARSHGMTVHGHNLVWNKQLPGWLTSGTWSRPELEVILHQHIQELVGHFRDQVHEWDVVNEPFNNDGTLESDIWSEVIGPEYIGLALRWAHEADPAAKLFINDYNIDWEGPKRAAMLELASQLKAEGVPLDGIGMEEHLSLSWSPSAAQIEQSMLSLQALGLDVEVTEMDVGTADFIGTPEQREAAQAAVFGEMAHACREVSACSRFSVWGVSDAVSWLGLEEAGLPFNANYEPKPAWRAIQSNLKNP